MYVVPTRSMCKGSISPVRLDAHYLQWAVYFLGPEHLDAEEVFVRGQEVLTPAMLVCAARVGE